MKTNVRNIQHRLKMPRKAILLAAGYGKRMEPLSWDLPKPLMPLCGVPLLEHALEAVAAWGVRDVLVNLHHAPQEILAWFREHPPGGPRIVFSYEPEILGTGGALRKARFFLGDEPCWLVNTDIAFVLDPKPLVRALVRHAAPAVLWLDPERGPRTVACNEDGCITNFAVSYPGRPGTYTYCGIQLFHPRLVGALPSTPFCSVIDACRQILREGQVVRGCVVPGSYWADLGTPARYLQAHADAPAVLRGREDTGKAGQGCGNSVLWAGSRLLPGACLSRSIVGRNVAIGLQAEDACIVRADVAGMDPVVRQVLRALRMAPASTLYVQLARRGSDRDFARLAGARRSAVLVRYRADRRPENARYPGHARFLAAQGLCVPRVLYSRPERGVLVLEDVGSRALQDESVDARGHWYRKVMRCVARLHAIPLEKCPLLEPAFDATLYDWEHALFAGHFLPHYAPSASGQSRGLVAELRTVARRLGGCPPVLLHRDLQSSNILLHGGQPVLIDFQGMRAGPAVYDLASLLYDPYVALTEEERELYLGAYLQDMDPISARDIRHLLPMGGIQRLVQVLGAFGRLGVQGETSRFAQYIPAACRNLLALLQACGQCPRLTGLMQHLVEEHHA